MKQFKDWLDIIAKWVAIIGAITGGTFALIKYYDNSNAERVKEALRYVDRYNSDPIHSARLTIDKFWKDHANDVFDRKQNELKNFVVDMSYQYELDAEADMILDFYEDLYFCSKTKLCNETIVEKYFGKKSYDFFCLYYPYIENLRDQLKDKAIGCGVETIAKSYIRKKAISEIACESPARQSPQQ